MRRMVLIPLLLIALSCDKVISPPGEKTVTVAEGTLTVYRTDTNGDAVCDTAIVSEPPGATEIPGERLPLSEPINPGDYTDVLFRYDYGTFMLLVGISLDTTNPGDASKFNYPLVSSDSLDFVGDTFHVKYLQYRGPASARYYYVTGLFDPYDPCPANGTDSAKVYYRVKKFR